MMRTFKAGTVAVLVALLLASGTSAQAPSPEGEPLPYGGYLAALEEFAASSAATTEHLGPASTVADVAAAYQESLALVEADQQRMLGIVPEPCYAAAHEEVLAYRETAIEFFREALPLMAESESVLDIFGVFEAMDADLRERHPAAYTEDPDAGGGFKGSYRTILAALVTCDEPASQRPWLRGRVEMLEHGFALTLPDGWVGIDMAGDIDQQITAVAEHLAAEPLQGHKPDLRAAVARSEDLGGWLVIIDAATTNSCGLVGSQAPIGATASDFGEEMLEVFAEIPTATEVEPVAKVDLPIGPAVSISMTAADPHRPYLSGPATMYGVIADERLLMATCSAPLDAPDDRWLSIAETFEFLPAEE